MSTKKIKLKTRKHLAQLNEALKADMRQHELTHLDYVRKSTHEYADLRAKYDHLRRKQDDIERVTSQMQYELGRLREIGRDL